MKSLITLLRRGYRVALHWLVGRRCADCGGPIGQDHGPRDGWQLEDGRTVCQACSVADLRRISWRIRAMPNAGGEFRRDSDVNSTALLAVSGGDK